MPKLFFFFFKAELFRLCVYITKTKAINSVIPAHVENVHMDVHR